jgi:hypothetical protein
MNRYWMAALVFALAIVVFVVRRVRESNRIHELESNRRRERARRQSEFGPTEPQAADDTAPAVLSPPEWNASNRRR